MTDRAISVQINYTLALVIVTILMSGVLLSTNDVLQNQRSGVVESELNVIGNRVAADVGATDQIAMGSGGTAADELSVSTTVPSDLAGVGYTISIWSEARGDHWLVHVGVDSNEVGVNETMQLKTSTPVQNRTIPGGPYRIRYVDTDGDTVPDALRLEQAS